MYKVGQKVRVKSWEQMEREYGINSYGSIKTPSSFTREMNCFCGMIFTIKNVRSGYFHVTYDLETNNKELNDKITHYYWDEEMLASASLLAQIIQRRKNSCINITTRKTIL